LFPYITYIISYNILQNRGQRAEAGLQQTQYFCIIDANQKSIAVEKRAMLLKKFCIKKIKNIHFTTDF